MKKAMLIVLIVSAIIGGIIGAVIFDEFWGLFAGVAMGIGFAAPIMLIIFIVATAISKGYSGFLAFLLCFFAGIPILGALIIILLLPDCKI